MSNIVISSRNNELVCQATKLHQRKYRYLESKIWIENRHCVKAALQANLSIEKILIAENYKNDKTISEIIILAESKNIKIAYLTYYCFEKCATTKNPDGIGAICQLPSLKSHQNFDETALVLWQLQDPGNIGTLIRSSLALDCRNIVIVEPSVDIFCPSSIRASAGTIFQAEIAIISESEAIAWLTKNSERVIGLDPNSSIYLWELPIISNPIIISGNEPHGFPEKIKQTFHFRKIPMANQIESLNVTAATAIGIYELITKSGRKI